MNWKCEKCRNKCELSIDETPTDCPVVSFSACCWVKIVEKIPTVAFKNYWNGKGPLKTIVKITSKRRDALATRFSEPQFRDNWKLIIDKAAASDFLSQNWDGFDINWLLSNDTNYIKILEGKYDNKKKAVVNCVDKVAKWNKDIKPWLKSRVTLSEITSSDSFKSMLGNTEFRSWAEGVNVLVKEIR